MSGKCIVTTHPSLPLSILLLSAATQLWDGMGLGKNMYTMSQCSALREIKQKRNCCQVQFESAKFHLHDSSCMPMQHLYTFSFIKVPYSVRGETFYQTVIHGQKVAAIVGAYRHNCIPLRMCAVEVKPMNEGVYMSLDQLLYHSHISTATKCSGFQIPFHSSNNAIACRLINTCSSIVDYLEQRIRLCHYTHAAMHRFYVQNLVSLLGVHTCGTFYVTWVKGYS